MRKKSAWEKAEAFNKVIGPSNRHTVRYKVLFGIVAGASKIERVLTAKGILREAYPSVVPPLLPPPVARFTKQIL